ncbi:cytidine deaminase [Candidatus Bathyarchaeota archaeon]|nr:cytidine deaminase [Candidatus Bathyarchaeota archaeon]
MATDDRISKDDYFMEIAHIVAKRSTCVRRKVGAVLVKDNHIISTGYNGAPSGMKHCTPETCLRNIYKVPSGERHELCRGVHAEVNCIIQAATHGTAIQGKTTLYTTTFPCMSCLKLLLNAKIRRIMYAGDYKMDNAMKQELLDEAGIEIERIQRFPG